MMENINYFLKTKNLILAILAFFTFLIYSNSLNNSFVIEDEIYIKNWQLTHNLSNIPKMFAGDTAPTGNYGIYRPMRAVYYAFSYQLFKTNPFFYHFQAVLIHIVITIFVFLIYDFIFKSRKIAFLAGLLFGFHPIHTESIDYLTANFDAISYIFFFSSFYFFLKAFKFSPQFNKWFYLSIIMANIAFYSFEMTLTLPFLMLTYIFLFERKIFNKKNIGNLLRFFTPYMISFGVFLFIRIVILNMTIRGEYLGGSFYLTMLTMIKVVFKYILLLVFPYDLSINPTISEGISSWVHPLAKTDKILSQSIFDFEILIKLGSILGLIFSSLYFIKKFPIISFSILWFFISILPISYIIPQGPIMQERYIYIASFGFVMLLSYLFFYFYCKESLMKSKKLSNEIKQIIRPILVTILVFSFLFYSYKTFIRNKDWKDSFAVWTKLAQQSPDDVLANFYSGNLYAERNLFDSAIASYNKTLTIEPRLHESHFALGEIFYKLNQSDRAAVHLLQALAVNPQYKQAEELILLVNEGKEASNSAIINHENIWVECKVANVFFFCPNGFETTILHNTISLKDPESNFTLKIEIIEKENNISPEKFIEEQKDENLGNLINQGLAQIPNSDFAFVQVFEQKNEDLSEVVNQQENPTTIQKFQFFIFQGNQVIKALVYPIDSPQLIKFDRIVSSLRFIEEVKNTPNK